MATRVLCAAAPAWQVPSAKKCWNKSVTDTFRLFRFVSGLKSKPGPNDPVDEFEKSKYIQDLSGKRGDCRASGYSGPQKLVINSHNEELDCFSLFKDIAEATKTLKRNTFTSHHAWRAQSKIKQTVERNWNFPQMMRKSCQWELNMTQS